MVIPSQISFTNSYYAVKLQSTFNSASIAGYLSSFVGSIVTGGISGITARVVGYADATTTDEPTLYVKYLTTATNSASSTGSTGASVANATYEFVNGESLSVLIKTISSFNASGSNSVNIINNWCNSTGSSAAIEEGVYFVRGQFVRVCTKNCSRQIYKHSILSCWFTVTETLVTPESDTTLLDNATGSTNVNAKGAHRLKDRFNSCKITIRFY